MAEDDKTLDVLDDLFAQARHDPPAVPADLTQRIVTDALTVQAEIAPRQVSSPEAPGLMQQVLAVFGGWPALGGMVAASLVGVWIGVAPPEMVSGDGALLSTVTEDLDLFDSFDLESMLLEEG